MLRSLVRYLIPNRGDVFFDLFAAAAQNAYDTANLFVAVINEENAEKDNQLSTSMRVMKQKAIELNKQIFQELNNTFITPIERGDIQELASLFLRLTKRVCKISSKLKLYSIDAKADDCIIRNANTLLIITRELIQMINALKAHSSTNVNTSNDKINELEENGIEDLRHAINEMYSGNFDTLTILKLKEIYKSVDSAIECGVSIADLVLQISIKEI